MSTSASLMLASRKCVKLPPAVQANGPFGSS
jgi:hypothetical protein